VTSAEEASLTKISRSLPKPGSRQRVKQPGKRIRLSLQHIRRTCLLAFESPREELFFVGRIWNVRLAWRGPDG
jgi:hypothetical protein